LIMTPRISSRSARWAKSFVLLTLLAAFALPLAACGKKGPLDPPPGSEDSQYPRSYPTH
jgi:predicted small lipoprotein YifL